MMTRGSLAFLDTNVLLSATDESRSSHRSCRDLFDLAPGAGVHFVVTGQVFREYLVVATRPEADNGLGLSGPDAVRNVRAFRTRVHLLPESKEVVLKLIGLVGTAGVLGKRIHDANIVAAAIVHRVPVLVTDNTEDYRAFSGIDAVRSDSAAATLRQLITKR